MDAPKTFDDLLREFREALEKLDATLAELSGNINQTAPIEQERVA